jgi:phosphoenolpyruvate carboxykinase (ATP)
MVPIKNFKSLFLIPQRRFHYLSPYVTTSFHYPYFPISNLNFKYNLDYSQIRKQELLNKEGHWTNNSVLCIDTNVKGRSPKDKYIVSNFPSKEKIWWSDVNKPMTVKTFNKLKKLCIEHFENNVGKYYIFDGYCGASIKSRKKVRFITEYAWQYHFVKNMFISDEKTDMESFQPDMTIINSCNVKNKDWKKDGLHSENFICFHLEKKLGLIGGTHYAGEMKKGIFSLMNYWLPQQGILPMHCSANINKYGDTTLFFGLSGTGKTTLSTDETTKLIGDDEHGWNKEGVFNLEGGCYAKTLDLKKENEPLIYNAIKPNAILENIYVCEETKVPDYKNSKKTENGRVSYPLSHLPNRVESSTGSHPKNIIFLCCDMYGVLPSVAKLSKEQAIYYFLSGYTSKVGGTERGITIPEATFSPCFGGAFLTLTPKIYGDLLLKKLYKHDCNIYLVNTGWQGGQYGVGKRYSIQKTRTIVENIMSGMILEKPMIMDKNFFFLYPEEENPETMWKNKTKYYELKKDLIVSFQENFKKNNYSKTFEKFGPCL